jgi:TolB protein
MSTAQGLNLQKITNLDGIAVSPAWSHDGQKLAFVFLDKRYHNLCVWDRQTRTLDKRRLPGNTLIAPAFTKSGNVAISLDMRGNPDIYELNSELRSCAPLKKTGVSTSGRILTAPARKWFSFPTGWAIRTCS